MNYQEIIFTIEGQVANLTLNRPTKLNAMTNVMAKEMLEAFNYLVNHQEIRIVVISGEGRAFSAGVDLKATSSTDFQSTEGFMYNGYKLSKLLPKLPQVIISKVHGFCFTGALELILMTDLIYCTRDTIFGDTHAKWSIIPRWGMTQRLSRQIGLMKAKELSFRAQSIDGVEAETIGLVNRALPKPELDPYVAKVCEDILANSPEAILEIKRLYNEGFNTTLAKGLEIEKNAKLEMSNTDALLSEFDKKKGI